MPVHDQRLGRQGRDVVQVALVKTADQKILDTLIHLAVIIYQQAVLFPVTFEQIA